MVPSRVYGDRMKFRKNNFRYLRGNFENELWLYKKKKNNFRINFVGISKNILVRL